MKPPAQFKNEKEFTRFALREARARGWLAAHLSNMTVVRRRDGHIAAVPDRDADGFPDLVLVHAEHGRVWAELKMPGRKPDAAQLRWLTALRETGERVYIWWPQDVGTMLAALDGERVELFAGVA